MTTGVLYTRLLTPRAPPDALPRTALVARLRDGLRGRLVTVLAGAGYGKSTIVSQAVDAAGLPTVWVACDERIGGLADLLAHVTAGVERRLPGFGARLTFTGSATGQTTALCNELAQTTSDDLILVLDDIHLLDPDTSSALGGLVRDLPPTVHLVLVGREPLGFALGKLRAGQSVAIGEADLALSPDEVDIVWRQSGGTTDVDGHAPSHIRAASEGWIAGIILAARSGDKMAPALALDDVFRYLAEEVLFTQPTELQQFVLRTAVLDRFSPQIAAAVTGLDDSTAAIDELLERHLFVIRLDTEGRWYRYHHLFRAFLLDEIAENHAAMLAEMNRRAAGAWLAEGSPADAVDHLLAAGDFASAAGLIDSLADEMRVSPQSSVLGRWIEAVPDEFHVGHPSLRLARAIGRFAAGHPEEGFAMLDELLDGLIADGEDDLAAAGFFALIYMQLAFGTRQRFAIDVGVRQLPRIARTAKLLPATLVLMASEMGCAARYDEAEQYLNQVPTLVGATTDPLGPGYVASARALFVDHPRGRSKQALAALEWVADLFRRNAQHDQFGYVAAIHAYRAMALNHLGRFDDALAAVDDMAREARRFRIKAAASRAMNKCRAVALAGLERWDELEALLAESEPPDQMLGSSFGVRMRAPAARLAAHRGDVAAVAHHAAVTAEYIEAFGFSFDMPGWVCDVAIAALQVGLLDEARRLRDEALRGADRAEAPWARARGQLLGAALLDPPEADVALTEALKLTDTWGFDEIWTRRDRLLAGPLLARAVEGGLGPQGLAARLAAQAGAEVLEHCARVVVRGPGAGRARLLDAMRTSRVRDPELEARLAGRPPGAAPGTAAPERDPLTICAFGGFSIRRGDEVIPVSAFGRERARSLLGALVSCDGVVHRDLLLEWLWPDLEPDRGLRSLHVTLHALRRALEPELGRGSASKSVVRADGDGYRIVLRDEDRIDVSTFLDLARERTSPQSPADVDRLLAAERAHTGPFYPEWPFAEWAVERRRELDVALTGVLGALGDHFTRCGDHDAAVLRFERLVQLEPERETFHRSLMTSYARAGEKALGLRQFHACRSILVRELGVEPSVQTRELYSLILADASLDEAASRDAVVSGRG